LRDTALKIPSRHVEVDIYFGLTCRTWTLDNLPAESTYVVVGVDAGVGVGVSVSVGVGVYCRVMQVDLSCHANTRPRLSTRTNTQTHKHTHASAHARMHACMHARTHARTHTHTHTHIHTHRVKKLKVVNPWHRQLVLKTSSDRPELIRCFLCIYVYIHVCV
jgi:hypothetical protein